MCPFFCGNKTSKKEFAFFNVPLLLKTTPFSPIVGYKGKIAPDFSLGALFPRSKINKQLLSKKTASSFFSRSTFGGDKTNQIRMFVFFHVFFPNNTTMKLIVQFGPMGSATTY